MNVLMLLFACMCTGSPVSPPNNDSIMLVLKVNPGNWNWEVAFTNKVKGCNIKLNKPFINGYTSYFTLYDSSGNKLARRCMTINPIISKKIPVIRDNITIEADSNKVIAYSGRDALDKLFCYIDVDNFIQYYYKTNVEIYDKRSGKLIKQQEMEFVTKKMKVGKSSVILDSVKTGL